MIIRFVILMSALCEELKVFAFCGVRKWWNLLIFSRVNDKLREILIKKEPRSIIIKNSIIILWLKRYKLNERNGNQSCKIQQRINIKIRRERIASGSVKEQIRL